jgi:hypothetical protein
MKFLLIIAGALLVLAGLLSLVPGFQFSIVLCVAFAAVSVLFYYFLKNPTPLNTIFRKIILVFLIIGTMAAGVTAGFIWKAAHPTQAAACRYIIVLGAGVNGTEPSRSLNERIQAAHNYLSSNPESVAMLTGGQGKGEENQESGGCEGGCEDSCGRSGEARSQSPRREAGYRHTERHGRCDHS